MAIIPSHMFKNFKKSISATVQHIPDSIIFNKSPIVEEQVAKADGIGSLLVFSVTTGILLISGMLLVICVCFKYKPYREVRERSRRRGLIYQDHLLTEKILSGASALPISEIQSSFSNPLFKVAVQSGPSFQETCPQSHSLASQETSASTSATAIAIELNCLEKTNDSIDKSFDSVFSHESSFSKRKSERNKKQTIFYGQ